MTIEQLEEFVMLAELKSYRKASEAMGISHSTLTKHIAMLEKELDTILFDRTTRKVEITEYGELFLPFAKDACHMIGKGKNKLDLIKTNQKGIVTLGVSYLASETKIRGVIKQYKKNNHGATVNVVRGAPEMLEHQLKKRKCDILILRRSPLNDIDNNYNFRTIGHEELVCCFPENHPKAFSDTINIQDLKEERFILMPPHHDIKEISIKLCHSAGFEPNVVMTDVSIRNCKYMVSIGAGIALLPRSEQNYVDFPGTRSVSLYPTRTFDIDVIYPANPKTLSDAAGAFLNMLLSEMLPE